MPCSVAGPGRFSGLCAAAVLALAGCTDADGVRTYTVPKPAESAAPVAEAKEFRILGAIFPSNQPAWFFKLTGPADRVAAAEAQFDAVVRTVRFPKGLDSPPEFDVPEGVKRGGGRTVRGIRIHATLQFPDGTEATVTASGGGLLVNLERWAGQVGAVPPTDATLVKVTKPFTADKVDGLRVDLRGPRDPAAGMAGPFMKGGR